MTLRAHLLELARLSIGEELLPGARLVGASVELGGRLSFEVAGRPLHIDVARADETRRFAARTRSLQLSYRLERDGTPVDASLAKRVCEALAARIQPHEDEVLARIAAAAEDGGGSARVREVRVDRVLELSGGPEGRYFTLNPYVGCLIGCRFCYAQSPVGGLRKLELLPEAPWGSYVDVRVNAAAVLARELAEAPPLPVKLCPIVSDPYQAVERRYRLVRACLEALRDAPPRPVLVLTRARLIERDLDVLAALPLGYVGASIPTIDDAVRRHFEPRAASIEERLAVLTMMRSAGLRTVAVVQPLLPGSIDALADALAARCTSVSINVLRGVEGASAEFADARYAGAADDGWQRDRALTLRATLEARGVPVWTGALPPELMS
jgi:DNA repair photolyase